MDDPSKSKVEVFLSLLRSSKSTNVKYPMQNWFVKRAEAIPKLGILSSKEKRKALIMHE